MAASTLPAWDFVTSSEADNATRPFHLRPSHSAGAARGIEIGNVISSAIDTALPGIGKLTTSIVEIFKPKAADKKAKEMEVVDAVH